MLDVLQRYLPPRLVQALLLLVVLVTLFGAETVRTWIEALGATAALRLLGIEAP